MQNKEREIPPIVFGHVIFFVLLMITALYLLLYSILQLLLKYAPVPVSIAFLLVVPLGIINGIRSINKKERENRLVRTLLFVVYLVSSAAACIPLSVLLLEKISKSSMWVMVICIILTLSWYIASIMIFQRQVQEIKIALIWVNAAIAIANEFMGIITVGARIVGLTKTLLFPTLFSSLVSLAIIEFIVYIQQEDKQKII